MDVAPKKTCARGANNDLYRTLGERWYEACDDPVALLRAEARLRNPWVVREIARAFGSGAVRVLDVGCGAGFLANHLAQHGHEVHGVDLAQESLSVAEQHDPTHRVRYEVADARSLPFPSAHFQVVCAMDFLEHVPDPERVIAEAARVLAPRGLFFFHTFNRNLLTWLVVIKGVEWFVANTPEDLHVLPWFIKPRELSAMCQRHALTPEVFVGCRPRFGRPLLRMLRTRTVPSDFAFTFCRSTQLGYSGFARKLHCDSR